MRTPDVKPALAALAAVLTPSLPAQVQGATLEALCRRAPLVMRARVGSVQERAHELHVSLGPERIYRGRLDVPPLLRESRTRHCGSFLHGLSPGQRLFVFARVARGRLTPLGGRRGLVLMVPGARAAIEALLATTTPGERVRLLALQLASESSRVRTDAALALPRVPGLERTDRATRNRIGRALEESVQGRRGPELLALLLAAGRALPRTAAGVSWSLYLDEQRPELRPLAERLLLEQLPLSLVAASAPSSSSPKARVRVARLLAASRAEAAAPLLRGMLADENVEVRRAARAALDRKPALRRSFRSIRPAQ
ncbi:MAG: hypothetical protein ACE5F1_01670 [Planctomycetota bacterium]